MSVVEHESSPPSRWLHERRWRISLWIAVVEAVIVALAHAASRWTVFGLAIVAFVLYVFVGRRTRSSTAHELTWILGASQALALVAAIVASVLAWIAFVVAAIFAVVALAYFLLDRR
jgi:hypothetical protein